MAIPDSNLNLCLVGGVSTGKSTSLNAIFLKDLSECKIKRTTMVPTIYVESAADFPPEHYAAIYAKVAETNAALIAKSESGSAAIADYAELVFQVGKLDIDIAGCLVNVYDIPGLNDARTKNVYMDYLTAKFVKFNVVVLFVDIMSGLNTSDEMDIVRFLAKNTALHHAAGRDVYTLVVVNKADDMQLGADGALSLTGELADMFAQVERTVCAEFSAVPDHVIGIIPLCALDAYLYRMVRKHGRDFTLSPQQVLKIGVNEQGKKFSKLTPATQLKKVQDILEDKKFIEDMIQLSGFRELEKTLQHFLETKFTKMSTENLLMQLKEEMAALDAELAAEMFPWDEKMFPWDETKSGAVRVKKILQVYADLEKVDKATADACTVALYEKLRSANFDQFMKFQRMFFPIPKAYSDQYPLHLFYGPHGQVGCYSYYGPCGRRTATPENLALLLNKYDNFREYAHMMFPEKILDGMLHEDTYPFEIVEAAFETVLDSDLSNLDFLEKIGCMNVERVNRFIKSIVREHAPSMQVPLGVDNFSSKLATTLQFWAPTLESIGVDMPALMREIIINFIRATYHMGGDDEHYIRLMLYNKAREIPVRLLLESLHNKSPTYETAVAGLKKDYSTDPRFALDFMYLEYC
jgi:hypothetical protein